MKNNQNFSYYPDKVVYVEPNYTIEGGKQLDDFFKKNDEDYCITVDLEVELYSRNEVYNTSGANTILMSWKQVGSTNSVSFLQGKKYRFDNKNDYNVLTTNYTDTNDYTSTESFGIESIDIQYNNYFVPQVEIHFKDIRGVSLFAPEELRHNVTSNGLRGCSDSDIAGSFFKCFFTFPYPKFTLTVKGFYGQSVRYELSCSDFRANFDSNTGNFGATAKFLGFDFSFLNDVSLNAIIAAPHSPYIGASYWEEHKDKFVKLDGNGNYVTGGMPKISDVIRNIGQWSLKLEELKTAEDSPGRRVTDLENILSEVIEVENTYKSFLTEAETSLKNRYAEKDISSDKAKIDNIYYVIDYEGYGLIVFEDYKSNSFETLIDYSRFSSLYGIEKINELVRKFNEKGYNYNLKEIKKTPLSDKIKPISLFVSLGRKLALNKDSNEWNNYANKISKLGIKSLITGTAKNIVKVVNNNIEIFKKEKVNDIYCQLNLFTKKQCYLFDNVEFVAHIKEVERKLNDEILNAKSELNNKIKQLTIGEGENEIVPNIENVTRMLMAHLETYMAMMSNSANLVLSQKPMRTASSLGMNLSTSDLNSLKEVGPWPAIRVNRTPFNRVTDSQGLEDGWIGDLFGGSETPERNVIDGLLKGVEEISTAIEDAQEILNEIDERNPYKEKDFELKYPITTFDLTCNGNVFGEDVLDMDNKDDILSRMFIRMINVLFLWSRAMSNYGRILSAKDLSSEFGRIDALNFIDIYGNNNKIYKELKNIDFKNVLSSFTKSNTYWDCYIDGKEEGVLTYSKENDTYYLNENVFKHVFPLKNLSLNDAIACSKNKVTIRCNDFVLSPYLSNSTLDYTSNCKVLKGEEVLKFKTLPSDDSGHTEIMREFYDDLLSISENSTVIHNDDKYRWLSTKFKDDDYANLTKNDRFKYGNLDHTIPRSKEILNSMSGDWYGKVKEEFQTNDDKVFYKNKDVDVSISRREDINFENEVKIANSNKESSLSDLTIPSFMTYISSATAIPNQSYFISLEYEKLSENDYFAAFGFLNSFRNIKSWGDSFNLTKESILNEVWPFNASNYNKISEMPYFSMLVYGGSFYLKKHYYGDKLYTYADSVIGIKDYKNLRQDIKNVLMSEYEYFIENHWKKIKSAFAIVSDKYTLSELRDMFRYENKKKMSIEVMKTLNDSFFENYLSFNNKGTLYHKQDSEMVKYVLKLLFTPCLIFINSFDEYYNTVTYISSYLRITKEKQSYCENYIKSFLTTLSDEYKQVEDSRDDKSLEDEEVSKHIRIALYKYCKNLYDRWGGSESFTKLWDYEKLMKRFHFIDCYYNNIGMQCMIDMRDFINKIVESETSSEDSSYYSLATFMHSIFSNANVNMVNIQNFIDLGSNKENGEVKWIKNMQKMFEPISYLDMERTHDSPQFVCMYMSETSKHLDIENGEYKDDSFMLNEKTDTKWPEAIKSKTDTNGCPIPAFGVTYGGQYQSYFKDINVSMDGAVPTEQALKAQFLIASKANPNGTTKDNEVFSIGQDLYTIYSNNSYECTVKMLGCAWIQPLMYFVLTNIPLFRGSYLIKKVTHTIKPGFMETTFTGVRMANTSVPFVDTPLLTYKSTETPQVSSNFGSKTEIADISNDCDYYKYPIYEDDNVSEGGFTLEELNNPITDYHEEDFLAQAGVYMEGEGKPNTYLDTMAYIAFSESSLANKSNSDKNKLSTQLPIVAFFNRTKLKGKLDIGCLQVDTKSRTSSGVKERIEKNGNNIEKFKKIIEPYKDIVKKIFIETPAFLYLQRLPIENYEVIECYSGSETTYVEGGVSSNKYDGTQLSMNQLQRLYFFMTQEEYVDQDQKFGPLKCKDGTRYGTYYAFAFRCGGHIFSYYSTDENKTLWEYKKKDSQQKVEKQTLADKFVNALQKTIDKTQSTEGVKITSKIINQANPNTIFIESNKVDKNDIIFDIILSTYYDNISYLAWVGDNSNVITSKYPSMIKVTVTENGDNNKRYVECAWTNGNNDVVEKSTSLPDNISTSLVKSIIKKYKQNVNIMKSEVTFLTNETNEKINEMISKNNIESCSDIDTYLNNGGGKNNSKQSTPMGVLNWNEKLTDHITLGQLCKTTANNSCNKNGHYVPDRENYIKLKKLAEFTEQINKIYIEHCKKNNIKYEEFNLEINSGFRDVRCNGNKDSQHVKSEAVDIVVKNGIGNNIDLYDALYFEILNNKDFNVHQLLWEYNIKNNPRPLKKEDLSKWIPSVVHVGMFRPDKAKNNNTFCLPTGDCAKKQEGDDYPPENGHGYKRSDIIRKVQK